MIFTYPSGMKVFQKQFQHLCYWIAACFLKLKPYNVIQCPITIVSHSIIIMCCWLSSWRKMYFFKFIFVTLLVIPSKHDSKYWLKSIQLLGCLFPFIAIIMVWLFGKEANCQDMKKKVNQELNQPRNGVLQGTIGELPYSFRVHVACIGWAFPQCDVLMWVQVRWWILPQGLSQLLLLPLHPAHRTAFCSHV